MTTVYLLTETANGFFPRFGFHPTQRAAVDSAVQQLVEFTSACPASAHVLVATLAEAAELRAANHIPFELPIVTDGRVVRVERSAPGFRISTTRGFIRCTNMSASPPSSIRLPAT